jgi:hypothetical protein
MAVSVILDRFLCVKIKTKTMLTGNMSFEGWNSQWKVRQVCEGVLEASSMIQKYY